MLAYELNITNYTFAPAAGFDKVEGTFTLAGRACVVEAKCRNCSTSLYASHLLEKPKCDELARWLGEGYAPLYQFFQLRSNHLQPLEAHKRGKIEWHHVDMPQNTAGNGQAITKQVGYLEYDKTMGDLKFKHK